MPTRTRDEIVDRLRYLRGERSRDFLGFRQEVLLPHLTFEQLKEFLKEDTTPDDLAELEAEWVDSPPTEDGITTDLTSYMTFAWDKVEGHRGISASRSIDKVEEMLWLLRRDDVIEKMAAAGYPMYGAPKLAAASSEMSLPIPDDRRVQRMIAGEPCRPDCMDGCGN